MGSACCTFCAHEAEEATPQDEEATPAQTEVVQEQGPSDYHVQEGGKLAKALEHGTMAVIKAGYFEDCLRERQPFGHRAQIPPEAIWDQAEIVQRWYEHGFKSLLVVSYGWLSKSHPDPDLFHLPAIVRALGEMRGRWRVEPGVVLDYTSFYQEPRTPEQDRSFKECLSLVNLPYGHPDVTALKLTSVPADEPRGYDARGWTKFESDIIDSKPPSQKDPYGELNVLTCGAEPCPFTQMAKAKRRPPVTPERFKREMLEREELAKKKGVRLFTNGKDQPLIMEKYAESFRAIAEGVGTLDYTRMGLGPAGALLVGEALPHLPLLRSLVLLDNGLGPEGARALAHALPAGLTSLSLADNDIGDEGARALAQALPAGLEELDLEANRIGDEGTRALAHALPAGLTFLCLARNGIGDEGARALAHALPAGLTFLSLAHNGIGDEGARALAHALPAGLEDLNLEANRIGDESARALAQAKRANLHLRF